MKADFFGPMTAAPWIVAQAQVDQVWTLGHLIDQGSGQWSRSVLLLYCLVKVGSECSTFINLLRVGKKGEIFYLYQKMIR